MCVKILKGTGLCSEVQVTLNVLSRIQVLLALIIMYTGSKAKRLRSLYTSELSHGYTVVFPPSFTRETFVISCTLSPF